MQINVPNALTERALIAAIKLRKETTETALKHNGIDNIISMAVNDQINISSEQGTVGEDLKNLIGSSEYFSAAWRGYQSGQGIPESVVVALEERAALVSLPAGA